MPILLLAMLGVMGLLYIVFAFKEPPEGVRHFFRVPAIFIFLPDRYVLPAGRFLVGVLLIGTAVGIALQTM